LALGRHRNTTTKHVSNISHNLYNHHKARIIVNSSTFLHITGTIGLAKFYVVADLPQRRSRNTT